ncbi:MAG: type II secretion system protein, partial [Candidatus Muiribacteriota bacterium]
MSFFKRKNGITMIELMAVVVIISIFTVISVPEVAGYLREQKEKALLDNLNTMRQAISLYMQDHSRNKRRIPSGQYHSGNYFELFSLSQPSNQDEHLSFPLCLHQLVKDKYLLFIPQNPFTGDDSWEVRGFGEPVDNSNSWIQAVQKNPSTGKYDASFSISDYRPYIPKGTSNANLQLKDDGTPQSPIINDLIGVFDVRSGYEGGRDNFSDIDSWKQREQGTWKYIKNELLRLSLSYREKILEVNEVLNLVPANITVTAYMLDGSTKTVIPSWDWQNPLTPGPGTLSGTTYTAPPTAGQAILRATYTEDDITKYADLRLQIFAELDFLVLQPSLIPIVINNTVDLDAKVLVRAHYTDGSFSYVSGVKYTIIEGDGFMSGSTYNAPSTTGMVKVSVEYTQGSITKSQTLNIQVTAELEKIIIDEPERNVAAGEPYFLNSRPVYAYYGDGVTKELAPGEYDWILFNPDPSKGNLSGPGNSIYNAPNHENTVIITCVYTEGEITVQAELKLNVMKTIEEIYLSPLNIVVRNLDPNVNMNSRIKIVAEYTDGSTAEVSAGTWSMVSGLGEIESGWAYKVPTSEVGTALVRCAVSDWFQTKTKDISIEIKHRVKELVFDPPEGYVRAGEVFDLSAVNLQVLYTDGLTGSLNYGDCMVEVAPGYFSSMWSWDNDRLLSTVITASGFMFMRHHLEYDGEVKIFDYRINVLPRVKALKITPNEIELKTGDTFDLSVVTGIVEFHDGSTYVPGIDEMTRTITTLPLAKGLISGYEYQAPPDKANYEYITFAYEEDYDGNVPAETVTDTFEVFIHRVPVEIYVMPFPHETATFEGDPNRFDRMRMNQYYVFDQRVKIKVYWTDNTESISEDSDDPTDHEKLEWELLSSTAGGSVYLKDLEDTFETMAWVYEPAPITSGTAEVKVTFTHFGISQETTFKIVVLNAPEDVYLTPNKIHAYSGTEVYLGDIDVEVHFADGDIIYYKIGDYVPGSYIYLIDGKGDFEDVPYYDTETDQEVALFYVFYESNFFMSNPGILEVEVHVTPKRLDFVDTMANYTAVSNRLNYEIYYASWEGWKAAWDIWYYTDWPTWKAGPRITSPPVPPQSPYTVTDPYYSAIYDTWYTNWRNWADYFDKYPGYDLSYNSWKTAWDIWKPLWDTWLAGPRDIPPSLPPSSPYGPTDTPYYSEDYENWYNSFMYWLSFWESHAPFALPATYPLQPVPLGSPPADPAMAHWPPEPTAYAEYSFYKNVAAGADVYLHHTLSSGGIFLMVTYSDGTPVEVSIYDDAPSGNPTVINNVYMVDFDGMLEPVMMEYYYEILSGPGTLTAPPGKTNFIYTSPGDYVGEVELRAHFRQKDIHPDDSTTIF